MYIIFVSLSILLVWIYFGYFFYLSLVPKYKPKSVIKEHNYLVVIPTYNEEEYIKQKLSNLLSLDLQSSNVVVVDVSDDLTFSIANECIKNREGWKIISHNQKGRSSQINRALIEATDEIVIVSDADSLIDNNFEKILDKYFSDKRVGLVSGLVVPGAGLNIEENFWQLQNRIRALESSVGHCPVASGAFYAFRRKLVERLPLDVWADDIYIPRIVNSQGYFSIQSNDLGVVEIRSAQNIRDLLKHKVRKASHNIIEAKRKIIMNNGHLLYRLIYKTRCMQLYSPVIILFWLSSFILAFRNRSNIFIVLLLLFTSVVLTKRGRVFLLTNLALAWALLLIVFRKNPVYTKI